MNSQYHDLLVELKSLTGRTLVSFHSRGDVEAVASALALQVLLPKATVRSPDRLSGFARGVLKSLNVKEPGVLKPGELSGFDNVVLVDVANPKMLGGLEAEFNSFTGKKVVVDHHFSSQVFKNCSVFEFANRTSCCEVVFDVLKTGGFQVDKKIAALLLCGVVVDSGFFESSNEHTFRAAVSLMHLSGLSYADVKRITERRVDLNEVKTIAGNIASARFFDVNSEVVAFCACSSFESATASSLVKSGAAVAVCFNLSGVFSVVRSNSTRVFRGLNVAKFLSKATAKFEGECGGHELIAGGNVPVSKVGLVVSFLECELRDVGGG